MRISGLEEISRE